MESNGLCSSEILEEIKALKAESLKRDVLNFQTTGPEVGTIAMTENVNQENHDRINNTAK